MAAMKFSQIASGTNPALSDQILGVQGGTTDVLFTAQQLKNLVATNTAFAPPSLTPGGSGFVAASQSATYQLGGWTGTISGSPAVYQNFWQGNSALNGQGSFSVLGLSCNASPASGGMTGNTYTLDVSAGTQGSGSVSSGFVEIHAGRFTASISNPLGGVAGTPNGYAVGGKFAAQTVSGASYLSLLLANEISVNNGVTTTQDVIGLSIASGGSSTNAGTRNDDGIAFNATYGGAGYFNNYLIDFAPTALGFALSSTGTLMGAPASFSCAYGLDLSKGTFSGSPLVAPLITPASSSATGKAGSIVWDANFIYICTATNTWKRATLATF